MVLVAEPSRCLKPSKSFQFDHRLRLIYCRLHGFPLVSQVGDLGKPGSYKGTH